MGWAATTASLLLLALPSVAAEQNDIDGLYSSEASLDHEQFATQDNM
jgi:hypothetical protein